VRVAVGAIAKALLAEIDVAVTAHTIAVGEVAVPIPEDPVRRVARLPGAPAAVRDVPCEKRMIAPSTPRGARRTRSAALRGDRAGRAPRLGAMASADRRLDGRLAAAFHVDTRRQGGLDRGRGPGCLPAREPRPRRDLLPARPGLLPQDQPRRRARRGDLDRRGDPPHGLPQAPVDPLPAARVRSTS
jgi:hypothetical protein